MPNLQQYSEKLFNTYTIKMFRKKWRKSCKIYYYFNGHFWKQKCSQCIFFIFKLHYFVLRHSICNSLHHITTHIIHNIQYCFFDRKILSLQTCIYIRRHVLYYYIIYSSILPSPLSFFEEKKSYILYDNYYMKWKLAPNEIQMELFFTFLCVKIIIISNYLMYKCHQNLTLNPFQPLPKIPISPPFLPEISRTKSQIRMSNLFEPFAF